MDEENLRNQLYNHEKTPPPNAWSGIQEGLEKRKRRRFYRRLLMVSSVLIVLTGMGIGLSEWLRQPTKRLTQEAPKTPEPADKSNPAPQSPSVNKPKRQEEANRQSDKNHDPANQAQQGKASSAIASNNARQTKPNSASTNHKRTTGAHTKANRSTAVAVATQKRNTGLQPGSRLPFQVEFKGLAAPDHLTTLADQNPAASVADSLLETGSNPFEAASSQNWQWGIHFTPTLTTYQYQDGQVDNQKIDQLSATRPPEGLISETVLSSPQAAESHGHGFALGVSGSYQFEEHFSLKMGLRYAYTRQSFRARKAQQFRVPTDTIIRTGGFENILYDTVSRTQQVKATNVYHRLLLPVTLQYDITTISRWGFQAQAGVKGTYLLGTKGRFIARKKESDGQQRLIRKVDQDMQRSFNLRYHVGLGITYQLNPEWRLFAEPTFGQQLLPAFQEGFGIQRKARFYRLSLGVRKQF